MTSPTWLATHDDHGTVDFRIGTIGDDVIAEWIGVATLTASRDGRRHELVYEEGIPAPQRRKLESGSVRMLLRQLAGELALHGAAIVIGGGAVILLGASRQGKSTLAAALCARGGALLADDAVAVDIIDGKAIVQPTESDHWLDEHAWSQLGLPGASQGDTKGPIPARCATAAVPASLILDLTWHDDSKRPPHAIRSHGVAAFGQVLVHAARFVIDSPAHQRRELDTLMSLVEHVPVHVLSRPRRLDAIARAVDIVMELCLKHHEGSR